MLSIREIGELCGRMDTSYFSKVFREYCGLSPREYRKRMHVGFIRIGIRKMPQTEMVMRHFVSGCPP